MLKIGKTIVTPAEKADLENAVSQEAKNAATIEYVAMMADVDLEEEDSEDAQQDV